MPPKRSVRAAQKGRRSRNFPTTQSIASTPSARRNAPKTPGRTTKNSTGNRGKKTARRTPIPKVNGRGRRGASGRKDPNPLDEPNCYKAENGEIYRPGDYAFVDSQQPDLPYHICVIRDFKLARKDSFIVELKWFYRVSELPEAIYLLLMEDRKKGKDATIFLNPKVNDRELFLAFNVDTHPASLLRGKCQVREFSDIGNLAEYMENENSFFYCHGYKPESRRLTDASEESFVPQSLQADIPECVTDANGRSPDPSPPDNRYDRPEERIHNPEELVWKPHHHDDELLMYLRAARSIAMHAGVFMKGHIADGYLAASSDETTQHAFDILHKNSHNMEHALQDLVKRPIISHLMGKKNWSKESTVLFAKGMRQFGKNFHKIKKELLPKKEIKELTEYYYYWKKTNAGLSSRNTRRQRKQSHIRLSRAIIKPPEATPEREFMDLSSCDEDEEGEDKPQSYHACRHCYTQESPSWHHAGVDRAVLCQECRLHFQRYGCMKPLTVKREPPEFMFKEFHATLVVENHSSPTHTLPSSSRSSGAGGRKTRNSNGSRGIVTQPRLRSGKNYIKSDTDEEEEAEVSETSESSFEEELPHAPINKPKLQTRRSILDNLDENISKQQQQKLMDELPAKKMKRDKENETNDSDEEEGSLESTNGEADQESSLQKSPSGDAKSPDNSCSTSSNGADDEGSSPCSSQGSLDHASSSVPQQFTRVSKDRESTCARTELVYVHPTAEEKKLATATTKVIPPFAGPASTPHHGDQPGSSSTSSVITSSKVPIITPHAPQLPMGPGPFLGFPPFTPYSPLSAAVATTPGSLNPGIEFRRSNSIDATITAASREREEATLLQHHQQQLLHQAMFAQQKQLELHSQMPPVFLPHALHPPHATAPQGFAPPPSHSEHGQPMFNFPSPEEMAARRHMATQMGIPEHFGMLPPGVMPPGIHPGFVMEGMVHSAGRLEDHGAGGGVLPTPHFMPAAMANMELMAQHQQQQAALAAASPGIPMTPESLMEFQRQIEMIMQQVQKDPSVLQHPHVQLMLQQHQRLVAAAMMHEHMVNQQRMHELSMIQQQQQEMQKQLVLGRPGHEDGHHQARPGVRPGVIMQTSTK